MTTIDTTAHRVVTATGYSCYYELERRRKWNVGLRKHTDALSGRIVVYDKGSAAIFVSDNWEAIKARVELWAQRAA